jgi:hypothetical protein
MNKSEMQWFLHLRWHFTNLTVKIDVAKWINLVGNFYVPINQAIKPSGCYINVLVQTLKIVQITKM